MKVADAVAQVLKAEGVKYLFAYPVNSLIEAAARLDIRTIIVRQERTGLHMADAVSRVSSGQHVGAFCMQHGPGAENAFGGVAQAFSESVPLVVLPMGYARDSAYVQPNFSSAHSFRSVTKLCEQVALPSGITAAMRRAFTAVRTGRLRPALVEIPLDILSEEVPGPFEYRPVQAVRSGPDPDAIDAVAQALLGAQRPVLFAGQGIHYARAWAELLELAELLEAPVTTTLSGKSAFPENHPLALGCAGRAYSKTVGQFLESADLIFGIGCSFTKTLFGIKIPKVSTLIHATVDPSDLHKDVVADHALVGDAQLTLRAVNGALREKLGGAARGRRKELEEQIRTVKQAWTREWMPKLTSPEAPLSPFRVLWDLFRTVDLPNTIITHDAGSPRDQLTPFWEASAPLSYLGWGKTTQLGYGLGLAMGAKLEHPEKLCINVWGDAAIGFTGTDLETAVRERIPILSVLLNNSSMACEIPIMQTSTAKFGSTNISGHYADFARALGAYGERVQQPEEIIPAIQRGIEQTRAGKPALLEFITSKETAFPQG